MVVPLLAGAAKTMVISMLSEKVVLRVMLMLAEWAAASLKRMGNYNENRVFYGGLSLLHWGHSWLK